MGRLYTCTMPKLVSRNVSTSSLNLTLGFMEKILASRKAGTDPGLVPAPYLQMPDWAIGNVIKSARRELRRREKAEGVITD